MFPSSTKTGGGQYFVFPDVCKVPIPPAPSIPVPYPHAAPPLLTGNKKAKVTKSNVIQKAGEKRRPMSSGDEAGISRGIASSTQGKALVDRLQTMGFSDSGAKLLVEGKPLKSACDQILLRSILSK